MSEPDPVTAMQLKAEDFFKESSSGEMVFDSEKVLKLPWFYKSIDSLPEQTRNVFEKYVGLPADEVEKHIIAVVSFPTSMRGTQLITRSTITPSAIKLSPSFPTRVLVVSAS
jgi:hypothetical protein